MIVPAEKKYTNVTIRCNGPVFGQGNTEVLVDGVRMKGITKIEIVGDIGDGTGVWRAVIHVMPDMIDISSIDDVIGPCAAIRRYEPPVLDGPKNEEFV